MEGVPRDAGEHGWRRADAVKYIILDWGDSNSMLLHGGWQGVLPCWLFLKEVWARPVKHRASLSISSPSITLSCPKWPSRFSH